MKRYLVCATCLRGTLPTSVLIILLSCSTVWAKTGTIAGRVVDPSGAAVPDAAVLIRGTELGATVDPKGNFSISNVPIGTYVVVARRIGFHTSKEMVVQISADQTAMVELTLTIVPVRIRPIRVHSTPIRPRRPRSTREDTTALLGVWRFLSSSCAWSRTTKTPRITRLLYFCPNGTYVIEQWDSSGDSLSCIGKFVIHPSGGFLGDGSEASLWIEHDRCSPFFFEHRHLVAFRGRDTMMTYPGGGNMGVSDACTETYVRTDDPEPILGSPVKVGLPSPSSHQQGVLYLGGNEIPGPYDLSFDADRLVVNGLSLPAPPEPAPATVYDLTGKPEVAFIRRIGDVHDSLRASGASAAATVGILRSMCLSNPLIDSVSVTSRGLTWRFRSGQKSQITFASPGIPDPSVCRATIELTELQQIRTLLDMGCVVFIRSHSSQLILPAGNLLKAKTLIARLRARGARDESSSEFLPIDLQAEILSPLKLVRIK